MIVNLSMHFSHPLQGAVLRLKKSPTTRRLCSPLPVVLVTDPGSRKALYSACILPLGSTNVCMMYMCIYCEYIVNINIDILHDHIIYSYNIIAYRIILHEHIYI